MISNRSVLVANIDTIKGKNLNQFNAMAAHNCRFVALTTDSMSDSKLVGMQSDNLEVIVADRAHVRRSMLRSLLRLLRTRHFDIAELYPSSHLSLVMAILIKAHRIPLVIIARGEEHYYL